MFTGLVEMTGVLAGVHGEHLRLRPSKKFENPVYGESVAVNGCCLTLERELAGGVLEFALGKLTLLTDRWTKGRGNTLPQKVSYD